METCTRYLDKAYKQILSRKEETLNMEEWENIFTLLQWDDDWYIDHDQYDTMNEWNALIYRAKHSIIKKSNQAVSFP